MQQHFPLALPMPMAMVSRAHSLPLARAFMAELSCCRDHMACKVDTFTLWPFTDIVCGPWTKGLTPAQVEGTKGFLPQPVKDLVHWVFQARVLEWGAIAFSVTGGYSLVAVRGFLIAMLLLLWSTGSRMSMGQRGSSSYKQEILLLTLSKLAQKQ